MHKSPPILALWLIAGLAFPGAALACRISAAQTPILHDSLPALPLGALAAEVEIVTDIRSSSRPPLEARIISMIEGDYAGSRLRIEPQIISSCDGFPYPGQRGIVVGRILAVSDEMLVIDPIRGPSGLELQRQHFTPSPAPND